MKKLILFLFVFSSAPLLAQPAKVLICASRDTASANRILASLQKYYHAKIDVTDTITDAINNYDAVFVSLNKDTLDDRAASILKNYLGAHRKLYVEYNFSSLGHLPAFHTDSNSFWKYIGIDFI